MSKVCLAESDFGRWTLDLVLVDPTGLEPAPYGLKVRYSATRVPGQESSFNFRFQVSSCSEEQLETWNLKLET